MVGWGAAQQLSHSVFLLNPPAVLSMPPACARHPAAAQQGTPGLTSLDLRDCMHGFLKIRAGLLESARRHP